MLKTKPSADFNGKRTPHILMNGILYKIKNANKHYNQRVVGAQHLLVIPRTNAK